MHSKNQNKLKENLENARTIEAYVCTSFIVGVPRLYTATATP